MRQFVANEARNSELLQQYRSGAIDAAAFKDARAGLVIKDPQGGSWFPGDESNTWMAWDGKGWIPSDPSVVLKQVPAQTPPAPPPIKAQEPPDQAPAAPVPEKQGSQPMAPKTQMVDEAELDKLAASVQPPNTSPGSQQAKPGSSLLQPPNLYLLFFIGFLIILLGVLVATLILGGDDDQSGSGVPYPAATSAETITTTPTATESLLLQGTPPGNGGIEDAIPLPPVSTIELPGMPPSPPLPQP